MNILNVSKNERKAVVSLTADELVKLANLGFMKVE